MALSFLFLQGGALAPLECGLAPVQTPVVPQPLDTAGLPMPPMGLSGGILAAPSLGQSSVLSQIAGGYTTGAASQTGGALLNNESADVLHGLNAPDLLRSPLDDRRQ